LINSILLSYKFIGVQHN